jgi:hypothetical protein
MEEYISKIIQQSSLENARYIPVLELVARLANEDAELADYFIETNVHNSLLYEIKKSMKIYFRNNSLIDENSSDSVEMVRRKYLTLSAEIKTLGGLLQASDKENRMKILKQDVVVNIVSVMGHESTDPILLCGICTFALDLFECEDLKYNEEFMAPFAEKISSLN